jgi:hypothetical protein
VSQLACVQSGAQLGSANQLKQTVGVEVPQKKVSLGPRDSALTDGWQVVLERGVKADDVAVRSLQELLSERSGLRLAEAGSDRGVIRLASTRHCWPDATVRSAKDPPTAAPSNSTCRC